VVFAVVFNPTNEERLVDPTVLFNYNNGVPILSSFSEEHQEPDDYGVPILSSFSEEHLEPDDWPLSEPGVPNTEFLNQFKLSHLSDAERAEVIAVLHDFRDIFAFGEVTLGNTDLVSHRIDAQGSEPIKKPPYKVPHFQRKALNDAIMEMIRLKVIQPSLNPLL
jgi:hypothetical protein